MKRKSIAWRCCICLDDIDDAGGPHGRPGEPPALEEKFRVHTKDTYSRTFMVIPVVVWVRLTIQVPLHARRPRPALLFAEWCDQSCTIGDGGGVAGDGGEGIARMAEQLEDALTGGGEVLVRLDEEITFDGVGRGIPCREGVPLAQAVHAPAHGSVDVGGEHVRCAGEWREEMLGHAFVRIKALYLRKKIGRILGRNIQGGFALFSWFSTLISGSSNYLMHAARLFPSFHRLLLCMHGTFSFWNT